jgi:hypothetical protein
MTDNKRAADDAEREAFEAWVSASGREHMLERDHPHLWYKDLTVSAWWTAWQARAALSSRADGGKGEAVLKLEGELAVAMSIIEAMRSELNAPQAERAPRDYVERDLVARARRIMEAVDAYNSRPDGDNRHALRSVLMDELEALKAECAPREAQPVAYLVDPGAGSAVDKFQTNKPDYLQSVDIKRRGGSVTPLYAAPTPERADADTAGAREVALEEAATLCFELSQGQSLDAMGALQNACGLIRTRLKRGSLAIALDYARSEASASQERADADTAGAKPVRALRMARACMEANGLGADKVPRVFAIIDDALQERADTGKDAALTDEQLKALSEFIFHNMGSPSDWTGFDFNGARRAILAANKEPK